MSDQALNRRRRLVSRAWRQGLSAGWGMILALGCGGKLTIYEVIINGGAPGATAVGGSASTSEAGTVSTAGSAINSGGVGRGGAGGDAAQGGRGGTAETGGVGGGSSDAGGAGVGGAGGGLGGAGTVGDGGDGGVACGIPIANVPADCHATIACDGTLVVDQNNVPKPANPCIDGTCNSLGVPGTAPAPAQTACNAAGGGSVCDGAGKCVPCLRASDCAGSEICSAAHQCVEGTCTDVDCGGVCPACATGKKCLADADCESFACDAVSLTCVTPQCEDHRQDGVETDADCGGGFCTACPLAKGCEVDTDCISLACDALKLLCINNQCFDHRTDGSETDLDCGGGTCGSCGVGQKCGSSFDCQSGHVCNAGKTCQ
jgi:hypothetical protein